MAQENKLSVLAAIEALFEKSKGCELKPGFFEEADEELKCLSTYLKLTKEQALITAVLFSLEYSAGCVDLKDMMRHFDCNPMRLLAFNGDLEALQAKGMVRREKNSRLHSHMTSNYSFSVNGQVHTAILRSEPIPELKNEAITDVFELLEKVQKLVDQRSNNEISTIDLYMQIKELTSSHKDFPLIQKIRDYKLDDPDTCIFLYTIWESVRGIETTEAGYLADIIFDKGAEKYRFVVHLSSGSNKLISHKYLEIVPSSFRSDMNLKLTERSVNMLKDAGIKLLFNEKAKETNVIEPAKITEKPLYFNHFEQEQLELLKKLLNDKNFRKTQTGLKKKGMPEGITALLHGPPGTGKTETVLQVAKATNREIVKVDISNTKSMWYGESEKKIKRIFTAYAEYAAECKRTPILLFNEADAIISKRSDVQGSNIGQTENTIQNILLDELENFNGIFFATTNLVSNLDTAFERRFLFKIELRQPEVPVKTKIWHSKLPELSEAECAALAAQFDLSGGQIENIIRKNQIHEIIHGTSVDFKAIFDFCATERILKNSGARIGFTKA